MVEFDAKVKKWGMHMGIELPKEIVKQHNIKENQSVKVSVSPRGNMMKYWGLIKDPIAGERLMKTFMEERARDRREEQEEDDKYSSSTRARR